MIVVIVTRASNATLIYQNLCQPIYNEPWDMNCLRLTVVASSASSTMRIDTLQRHR